MAEKFEISRHIAAPPEAVYAAISDVTEWSENLLPEWAVEASKQISGVDDRTERNRQTMRSTLERLSPVLEY